MEKGLEAYLLFLNSKMYVTNVRVKTNFFTKNENKHLIVILVVQTKTALPLIL
jgi:hypothetical protein